MTTTADDIADRPAGAGDLRANADLGTINRSGPIPYWAQLATLLRRGIEQGLWRPGEALPPETELCVRYGLSRTVVRQALQTLAGEGLVQREKGRGTFVSGPKLAELVVQEMRGFLDEVSARGHTVRTSILAQSIVATPPHVAPALGLRMRSECVWLRRVRSVDGLPVVIGDSYLPASRFAALTHADLRERSLYAVLTDAFGVRPSGGWRRIEAQGAPDDIAEALALAAGAPLLAVTAVSVDQDATPFEFFRAYYRGDRTAFEVRVEPSAGAVADDLTTVG